MFIEIDRKYISDILIELIEPIMEADLISRLKKKGFIPREGVPLYDIHFSLYHFLYLLKEEMGREGYYLHLDPMRIMMAKLPVSTCHHYIPEKGSFCHFNAEGSLYCSCHSRSYRYYEKTLHYDPLFDFYRNRDNITFCESDIFKKAYHGITIYAFRKGEVDRALAFMDISHPSKAIIQNRYHLLAKEYHPDSREGNPEKMKILNSSYQILKEVFI